MKIRKSTESDKADIEKIHIQAFGDEKGPEIATLVNGLLGDQTAKPILSLIAVKNNKSIGHIIYTKVRVSKTDQTVSAQILAPLAVLPETQSQGIGGQLIKNGLKLLRESGVELVFVLGHPDYYPRYGFKPAGAFGFEAPYPIPEEHAGAWMVQALCPGIIGRVRGKIQCSDVLNQPEHWRE